jgi:hypothetical protein
MRFFLSLGSYEGNSKIRTRMNKKSCYSMMEYAIVSILNQYEGVIGKYETHVGTIKDRRINCI